MNRLEALLVGLTGDSAAAALFRLGQLKRHAPAYMGSTRWDANGPGTGYAIDHPDDYLGNTGEFVYSGSQWKEHSLACVLDRTVTPYTEFLDRFPTSPYAESAAAKANEALTSIIAELDPDSARARQYEYEPATIDSLLTRYGTIATRLLAPWRADALRLTTRLRARLAELQGQESR